MFAIYIEARPQEYELVEEIASEDPAVVEAALKELEAARPGRYDVRDLGPPPPVVKKVRR